MTSVSLDQILAMVGALNLIWAVTLTYALIEPGKSERDSSLLIALLAAASVIAGIIIASDDNESPVKRPRRAVRKARVVGP